MSVVVIGVDPGKRGAFSWIQNNLISVVPMPETPADIAALIRSIQTYPGELCAFVENVASRPEDGSKQAHTFGKWIGYVEMGFAFAGIRVEKIAPGVWQRSVGLGKRFVASTPSKAKTLRKRAHYAKAKELFPQLEFTQELADAVLIAEVGRKRLLGIS